MRIGPMRIRELSNAGSATSTASVRESMGTAHRQTTVRSRLGAAIASSILFSATLLACSGDNQGPQPTAVFPVGAAGGTGMCPAGQLNCANVCTDVRSSAANCGACGRSCGLGICDNGQCSCPSTLTTCLGVCVDTQSDPANCGNCGAACGVGQACNAGRCGKPCVPACAAGQTCFDGVCSCPPGQLACAGMCVDTKTTPAHCGGCNMACAPARPGR